MGRTAGDEGGEAQRGAKQMDLTLLNSNTGLAPDRPRRSWDAKHTALV